VLDLFRDQKVTDAEAVNSSQDLLGFWSGKGDLDKVKTIFETTKHEGSKPDLLKLTPSFYRKPSGRF
jgi:hypothetical protein